MFAIIIPYLILREACLKKIFYNALDYWRLWPQCGEFYNWRSNAMWLFFCCLMFILTAPAWAQSQSPAARNLLTLEEAVNTALRDNRQVKNAPWRSRNRSICWPRCAPAACLISKQLWLRTGS